MATVITTDQQMFAFSYLDNVRTHGLPRPQDSKQLQAQVDMTLTCLRNMPADAELARAFTTLMENLDREVLVIAERTDWPLLHRAKMAAARHTRRRQAA